MSSIVEVPIRMAEQLRRAQPAVRRIVQKLEDAGYATWAVGGAVRDAALGRPSDEWDFATRARPIEVRRVFGRIVPVGIEHGTVGVLSDGRMHEVTTFRRDVEPMGRHAKVEFADTIEDDLARRDFTVNAIAWHPMREELLDPFSGLRDLEEGVLRTVGDANRRFREDYLRILRALRFAGQLDLRIDGETWFALRAARGFLHELSGERVREELLKVLTGIRPSAALALYALSGTLHELYPEIGAVSSAPDRGVRDRWSNALLVVDHLNPSRPELRLAVLAGAALGGGAHDRTSRDSRPVFERLRGLRFSNRELAAIVELNEPAPSLPGDDWSEADVRRWLSRGGRRRLRDRVRIAIAQVRVDSARGRADTAAIRRGAGRARAVLAAAPPLAVGDLAIDGEALTQLGLTPGPIYRRILEGLLEEVLEDPERNAPDYLRARALELVDESRAE